MFASRRHLLMNLAGVASVLALKPLLHASSSWESPQGGAQPHPAIQPPPDHNTPNGNFPPGLDGPKAVPPDQRTIDRANEKQLKEDAAKLFQMASNLKDQLSYTNTTATLSLGVVKQAQAIEKLAKQIKELAKG